RIADHFDTTLESPYAKAFYDVQSDLAAKPSLFHFDPTKELYVFIDASKEMGMGLAAYQAHRSGNDHAEGSAGVPFCKTDLRPVLFCSRELTLAETRYW